MDFKIGDRVRVIDYPQPDPNHDTLLGLTGTVSYENGTYVQVTTDEPWHDGDDDTNETAWFAPEELELLTPNITRIPEEIRDALRNCILFTEAHGYQHNSSLQEESERALAWLDDNTEDA